MALSPSRVLLLDEYTCIYLWIGQQAWPVAQRDDAVARLTAQLHAIAAGRVPCAQVMVFPQHHSMSRFLLCRLAPLHKDAAADQRAQFPALAALSDAELRAAGAQFNPTDEPSYYEYARRIAAAR